MLDILFGEGQLAVKLVVGLIVVIGLLAAFFYGLRRFGGERLGAAGGRGRQPRLAVIDAAMVDGRRRLVLIRRDNVEHLLIIGGPTDVVVEQNIVRAAGALPREAAPGRAPAAADALPRTVPLGEDSMWPLQPETAPREPAPREPAPREPAPRAPAPREAAPREPATRPDPPMRLDPAARPEPPIRLEPTMRSEPAPRVEPRLQRQSPPPLPPVVEEPMQWSAESEPPPPRERRPRTVDPLAGLAGLAEELARVPAPEPSNSSNGEERPRQPLRRVVRAQPAPPAPPPQPAQTPAADAQFNSSADQNLAEMAQRLEAALRRPAKTDDESRPAQDAPRAAPRAAPEPEPAESGEYEPAPPAPPPARPAAEAVQAPRSEAKPARADAKPVPQKSLYDSLEQEMASLLGRPNTKP